MPLYTVIRQTGALDSAARAKLASELTALHADYSGVPRNWVHIVFQDYAPGSSFTAGEAAGCAALTLLIRTGRSPEYKRELLKRIWKLSPGGDERTGRSDRHRHSRSAGKPGDGDGADHARGRSFLVLGPGCFFCRDSSTRLGW
jgi:phenylpyruvate tautomerase PptA (4-oxalocrotonate tautomerase family)